VRRPISFVAAAVLLVAASAARADEGRDEEYRRLVDEALSEFDARHFEEALAIFEQAYKKKPSPRALRGMAKALFELRAYVRCIETSDRALAAEVEPLTGALRADLESLRERAARFVGEASLDVSPTNATTLLDGQPVPTGGRRTVRLDVGPHTVEASATDHQPMRQTFEVRGGEVSAVALKLVPLQTRTAPAPDPRSNLVPLLVGALAVSGGGIVASSIWFVDRSAAVDKCTRVARVGAECANSDGVAFQHDAAAWTLVASGAAALAAATGLVLSLRGGGTSVRAACAPDRSAVACSANVTW
jgi:hypothetical protein